MTVAKGRIPGARHEVVVRIIEPHSEDCWAIEATTDEDHGWTTPWWHSDDMPDMRRARDGSNRHGYIKRRQSGRGKRPKVIHTSPNWTFIRLECNATNCQAVAIIDERSMSELAQAVLEGRL